MGTIRINKTMSEKNSSSGGIGFTGLLTVAFVVLKLCGVIAWSWWWVLSPIWITILLIIAIVVLAVIVKLFCE
jgi:membrane protein YdbS with pleckstrin-like domain